MVDLLRRMFFTDLNNKAMALVLAILVWAYAFNNTGGTDTLRVELKLVEEFPADQVIVDRSIKKSENARQEGQQFNGEVTLSIKAQKSQLEGYASDSETEFKHEMSISGTVNLKNPQLYDLPPGFSVESATPEIIQVEIEDLKKVDVPLHAQVIGTPQKPFQKPTEEGVQLSPEFVQIVGPQTLVDTLDEIEVVIELDGRTGPKAEFDVDLPGQLPTGIKYGPDVPRKISVVATLNEAKERRKLANIQVLFAIPADVSVHISNVSLDTVIFQGSREGLDKLEREHEARPLAVIIRPNLAVASDTPVLIKLGDLKFPQGTLPPGVSIRGMEPPGPSYNWAFVEKKEDE